MKSKPLCSKCRKRPPAPKQRYCQPCRAAYQRTWYRVNVRPAMAAFRRRALKATVALSAALFVWSVGDFAGWAVTLLGQVAP